MVNTRSQILRENRVEQTEEDRYPDNEDNISVADHYSGSYFNDYNDEAMRSQERDHERSRIEQRFLEMTKQIGELTSMVRALTEKVANSREESDPNVRNFRTLPHSDMVTGVSTNSITAPNLQQRRRTPPTPVVHHARGHTQCITEPRMDDVMTDIQNLRTTMTDGVIQPTVLQTQVPLFRGNREKYSEFEQLLKNHLRPHMHKLTEEQKLNYFQSLLRDDAIEFWQTLKINLETTLADILQAFNEEYAKEDLKEVSKYKFDQMRYSPTVESFTDFFKKFKKTAKQEYGEKASDIAETFLFAKLPVHIPNELAMAGKHDATVEEIKTFVQRRCQYAQLIPSTPGMQPLS